MKIEEKIDCYIGEVRTESLDAPEPVFDEGADSPKLRSLALTEVPLGLQAAEYFHAFGRSPTEIAGGAPHKIAR